MRFFYINVQENEQTSVLMICKAKPNKTIKKTQKEGERFKK